MRTITPLTPNQLRIVCDPGQFDFETTAELAPLTAIFGQERALDSLKFGIDIEQKGYNLFVMGPPGIGKHSIVEHFLNEQAKAKPLPPDLCYVHNFDDPQKPKALQLPHNQGHAFQKDMKALIEELIIALPEVLGSEEYRNRIEDINEAFKKKEDSILDDLDIDAQKTELTILRTAHGFTVSPTVKGEVLSTEAFDNLEKSERDRLEKIVDAFRKKLTKALESMPLLHKERQKAKKDIEKEFSEKNVSQLINALKQKHKENKGTKTYLDNVEKDIVENVRDFIKTEEKVSLSMGFTGIVEKASYTRYEINVLSDASSLEGAPILFEDNPNFANLIGRIEHTSHLGTLTTDFTLIRPGALHTANGGYLVLDVLKVLSHPYAWEGLKRSLGSQAITIEPLEQMLGLMGTVSLKPESIPLQCKVLLLGDRQTYQLLCHYDPEFKELFKVTCDFEEHVDKNADNHQRYAQLISTLAKRNELLPFHKSAVARIIEHSSRLVEDTQKLSTHMRSLSDLLFEADHFAKTSKAEIIEQQHVQIALDKQTYRVDQIRNRLQEAIQRGKLFIDTTGSVIGQVNGLSVLDLGDFTFGMPSRISATVRLGQGKVIDIEREAKLSGPIHSKGVLILSGFLGARYAINRVLSLTASIVFEQTYGMVEGDSASVAELCALLSALSHIPIKQSFALTGSINQHGQVQAIGCVNEKIEGFFDVCATKGLTGDQGVIIPKANLDSLMLREDVVQAVKNNQFSVYCVEDVDEVMELLTGELAGSRDKKGVFSKKSINYFVEKRLIHFADLLKQERLPPPK